MSKTDKTAPFKMKVHNRSYWLVEVHDHRYNHECDLPARPKPGEEINWSQAVWGKVRKPCHWSGASEFWSVGENRCGCPMCSEQDWRKQERRKERRQGKKQTRNWEKEW